MSVLAHITCAFRRKEGGGALVELGMVIPLFLLLIFGILEYGRLYWNVTMAQKAMQIASRLATVGPSQCGALPPTHTLSGSAPANTRFGALCRSGSICAVPALPAPCLLDTSTPYGNRIWTKIDALLPPGATPANVQFTYTHDTRLGFLGGPYTPVVTAELVNLDFNFVLPLGPLAALASGSATSTSPTTISIPAMSTSAPAEDLAVGAVE